MSDSIVYRVLQPIDSIGAIPGDYLVVRPGHKREFIVQRNLHAWEKHVMRKETLIR